MSTEENHQARTLSSKSLSPLSETAVNGGHVALNSRLRSVISHPFCLLLLWDFYERKEKFPFNRENYKCIEVETDAREQLNNVFRSAKNNLTTASNCKEPAFTKLIVGEINELYNKNIIHFNAQHQPTFKLETEDEDVTIQTREGKGDIVLAEIRDDNNKGKYTPLMLIEVALDANLWWKKFDQNVQYLDMLCKPSENQEFCFDRPLLLSVITYGTTTKNGNPDVTQIGVFFCRRRLVNEPGDPLFRMTLIWYTKCFNLNEASSMFGKILSVTNDFHEWRKTEEEIFEEIGYEYFSSNCCRIGDKVFRCYDSRYRPTCRSSVIYHDPEAVGGQCEQVLFIDQAEFIENTILPVHNDLWTKNKQDEEKKGGQHKEGENKGMKSLEIISTLYRPGTHIATKPKQFIPIIKHLATLHEKGYVHGDIRAFNTVFGQDGTNGWLIDFDLGNKTSNNPTYPWGYKTELGDGLRIGEAGQPIYQWHDWFALGQLIFVVHKIYIPEDNIERTTKLELNYELTTYSRIWENIEANPSGEEIAKVIAYLEKISDLEGLIFKQWKSFYKTQGQDKNVTNLVQDEHRTNREGSGSPLK